MKVLGVVALVAVILASTAVLIQNGGSLLAQFTSWNSPNAAVPSQVPFQAVLTEPGGAPVADGSYAVVFSFYPAATGGSPSWTETQTVQTSAGVFSTHLGATNPITPADVAFEELWLGIKVDSDQEMTPRQRVGSAIYALVAQELANPKHPTILLSHDGFQGSEITCFTRRSNLVVLGSGFQPNESVVITAIGGASDGGDANILTTVANSSGAFLAQGTSTQPAIPCSGGGPLSVVARGDKGSVSSEPVLVITPTPVPTPVPGTVSVAENAVVWATANGDEVTTIQPDSSGVIFVRDDALEDKATGTAVFSGLPAGSKYFNIATGAAGVNNPGTTTVTRVLSAAGYSTSSPASTPLTDRSDITVIVGGSSVFVTASDNDAGTFTIISGVSATTTANFKYHTQDVWSGTDSAMRRVKVISTSDTAGEWVTISEVVSVTDPSPNVNSRLFRGEVTLSSNPATQGTSQDGVWVLEGDIVTVVYVDSSGTTIDTDTLVVVP